MNIRECKNPDEIIEIIHAAFKRYENDPFPSSALKETTVSIQEEINKGILIFGVYEQNNLIAVVKCTIQPASLYFSRLSVIPSKQGKGIATNLIRHLEEYAKTQKLKNITCKVRKSEKGNISLYSNLGFNIIYEDITESKTGVSIPTVTMGKIIHI